MDRGIKDEGFVRKALEIVKNEDGRWVANQALFNGASELELAASAKAALVTAVNIYSVKNMIEESYIEKALAITTRGEARELIDELSSKFDNKENSSGCS